MLPVTWPGWLGDGINSPTPSDNEAVLQADRLLTRLAVQLKLEASKGPTPVAEHPGAGDNGAEGAPGRSKKSTEKGEARAKIIAALTKHHKYQEGVISLVRVNPGGIERLGNGVSWSWGARADKWRW
jgi:hypothetical protein